LCLCVYVVSLIFYFFFFSSRRRHTRSDRDWSSDVCSSDLTGSFKLILPPGLQANGYTASLVDSGSQLQLVVTAAGITGTIADVRSEERRVGKECRSRWAQAD